MPWIRTQIAQIDPTLPVKFETLNERVSKLADRPRFETALLGFFALTGLTMAMIGLYGVISFLATQRTQEIGVRMALGARPGHVLRMVVGQGLGLAVAGLASGLLMAVALARVISLVSFTNSGMGVNVHLLSGHANDALIYVTAVVVLSAVAVLASYLPARRAARTEPMQALRMD
jgi:ABC-type antimicrobial peptide transport system permease subunit